MFDWTKTCAYDAARKTKFHRMAKRRLKALAQELGLDEGMFDLRSNMGGIAVSGEITLHHERLYVQVFQSTLGPSHGIRIRTCQGRRDFTGGPNNWAHIDLLDDLPALASKIQSVVGRM
ncbi:MAG TPA: hypothetical protein VN112_05630 [Ensifer sp.]|nr:hypothetical protein [Ensifer sp.]